MVVMAKVQIHERDYAYFSDGQVLSGFIQTDGEESSWRLSIISESPESTIFESEEPVVLSKAIYQCDKLAEVTLWLLTAMQRLKMVEFEYSGDTWTSEEVEL